MRRTTVVVCERSALGGAECGVPVLTTKSLPLGMAEWKEWRFAATSDVLKLRLAFAVVKLKRVAARFYPAVRSMCFGFATVEFQYIETSRSAASGRKRLGALACLTIPELG